MVVRTNSSAIYYTHSDRDGGKKNTNVFLLRLWCDVEKEGTGRLLCNTFFVSISSDVSCRSVVCALRFFYISIVPLLLFAEKLHNDIREVVKQVSRVSPDTLKTLVESLLSVFWLSFSIVFYWLLYDAHYIIRATTSFIVYLAMTLGKEALVTVSFCEFKIISFI